MSDKTQYESKRRTVALAAVIAALLVLAYVNRFIQDDAFISFRYAQNLATGEGLVWNPGERVEGYTNFLWTLMMSVPLWIGRDPVAFSYALGLLSFVGTLLITYRLARFVCGTGSAAVLAVVLLGTNYTFSAYATGGLETQMQAFLVVSAAYLSLQLGAGGEWPVLRLVLVSLLYAAALLTRLDSAAALLPAFVYATWRLWKAGSPTRVPLSRAAALLLPAAIVVGAWLVWKYIYYGDVLPNSFYVKATASVTSARRGGVYLYHFFSSYLLLPFVLIAAFRARTLLATPQRRVLAATLLLWTVYVVGIGGDFMEFRFLVPVMPFGMTLLAVLIASFRRRAVLIGLTAFVIAGSIWHAMTFRVVDGIADVAKLHGHIVAPDEDWEGVGKTLGRLFAGEDEGVTIATTAAGAIPFYSRLRTIDQLGINDEWIARHGVVRSTRPGHQRLATHRYLDERGVHLVIGHPRVDAIGKRFGGFASAQALGQAFHIEDFRPELVQPGAGIVEIPVNERYKVTVLYLTPNEAVDRVIERHDLRMYPISLRTRR
jgi:arabinofuranosyltransferase